MEFRETTILRLHGGCRERRKRPFQNEPWVLLGLCASKLFSLSVACVVKLGQPYVLDPKKGDAQENEINQMSSLANLFDTKGHLLNNFENALLFVLLRVS